MSEHVTSPFSKNAILTQSWAQLRKQAGSCDATQAELDASKALSLEEWTDCSKNHVASINIDEHTKLQRSILSLLKASILGGKPSTASESTCQGYYDAMLHEAIYPQYNSATSEATYRFDMDRLSESLVKWAEEVPTEMPSQESAVITK